MTGLRVELRKDFVLFLSKGVIIIQIDLSIIFEELNTKRLFRDFVSRLFRSFATLVSWLCVTLASWFYHAWNVFVDSRYAWTVFVVSWYAWTIFVYSSYAWNVFVVSSYAWIVFVVLSYARLVFVTSSYACFVTSCHACFVACHACFHDFVSRLVIYPRVTVCPRLFRSLELRWFFVAFGLRLTCRFRAALVSWPLCCACYSLRVSSSIENKFSYEWLKCYAFIFTIHYLE